nr:MAG TPA: hypothetical protein [Caudoviricetes sp.]
MTYLVSDSNKQEIIMWGRTSPPVTNRPSGHYR